MRKVVPLVLLALVAVSPHAVADDGAAKPAKIASSAQAPKTPAAVTTPKQAEKPADAVHEAVRKILKRPAPRSLREAERRLAAIKVDVDFRSMDVTDAVDFIGRLAGFNVIVGPELQKDGLEGLPKITLKLRKASLKTVADLVARFTGTKMAFDGGILSFTTPEAARGKPVLRIYGIGEITFVLRNFPGPDMNLRPSGAEFEQEEQSDVENPFSDPEQVVEMLKEFIDSETWEDEAVSIWADERKLVVRQYPAVQKKIARFLAVLNASR